GRTTLYQRVRRRGPVKDGEVGVEDGVDVDRAAAVDADDVAGTVVRQAAAGGRVADQVVAAGRRHGLARQVIGAGAVRNSGLIAGHDSVEQRRAGGAIGRGEDAAARAGVGAVRVGPVEDEGTVDRRHGGGAVVDAAAVPGSGVAGNRA